MITQAQVLAYCRSGLDAEEIAAVLSAMASHLRAESRMCIALDRCIDAVEAIATEQEESELWSADDAACRRAQSLAPASSIHSFIQQGATA